MVDPRREAVLVRRPGDRIQDSTTDVTWYQERAGGRVDVQFSGSDVFHYGAGKVDVRRNPVALDLPADASVEIDGKIWRSVTEVLLFDGPSGGWCHVFWRSGGTERLLARPAADVRVLRSVEGPGPAGEVLRYLRSVVALLPVDDPLRRSYESLRFVHPESALARWLAAEQIVVQESVDLIFPFRRNLSQWDAVDNALSSPLSVVEGPPGTGKTETILNIIASVVASGSGTVAVVSHGNAAVDNVRDKLRDTGYGHMVAALGRAENRQTFFDAQPLRNARVDVLTSGPAPDPEELPSLTARLHQLDERLRRLYGDERDRATKRQEVDAHRLERDHFDLHLQRHEVPRLEDLPLLRRSSARIMDFLAETQLDHEGHRPGVFGRIRRYLRYGGLRGLDAQDTDVVLALQKSFYDKRIRELDAEVAKLDAHLADADFDDLTEEHQALSREVLDRRLGERYRTLEPRTYTEQDYRTGRVFRHFVRDYPVVLSSCHSLARSLGQGHLLDLLIIDEASQVDVRTAVVAMACCRNLVVVGDERQLAPVSAPVVDAPEPPHVAYESGRSILSSVVELYGPQLPRTLLREHYRCDPTIIRFCSQMFYGDQLVPFTPSRGSATSRPMVVHATAPGNHMRRHREGGRSNRRELDVIAEEVVPLYCDGVAGRDIGITTPYRLQASRAADLLDQHEADTVHRFQGRQKRVVVLSTVLDDTWRDRTGLEFVDDPRLVNVAVSRAQDCFILVTGDHLMRGARYLRDLVGYIRYQSPGQPLHESSVLSVFDLLYREYSDRLAPLAARVTGEARYLSENIIGTVLADLLAKDGHVQLTVARQVLLRNLLTDLRGLTPDQAAYVKHRASVDFVLYNRVTKDPHLVIEVDGFAYHEDEERQRARDRLKDAILAQRGLPLLRLPTTGSGEQDKIRAALGRADEVAAGRRDRRFDLRDEGDLPAGAQAPATGAGDRRDQRTRGTGDALACNEVQP